MLNHQYARAQMHDRERELRREIRDRRQRNQLESRSVRRAVGRSIIEIGHRIAAEPQPRLARSR
jgi:hypothetical protein